MVGACDSSASSTLRSRPRAAAKASTLWAFSPFPSCGLPDLSSVCARSSTGGHSHSPRQTGTQTSSRPRLTTLASTAQPRSSTPNVQMMVTYTIARALFCSGLRSAVVNCDPCSPAACPCPAADIADSCPVSRFSLRGGDAPEPLPSHGSCQSRSARAVDAGPGTSSRGSGASAVTWNLVRLRTKTAHTRHPRPAALSGGGAREGAEAEPGAMFISRAAEQPWMVRPRR
mmetsp:Transcript_94980/g.205036  ORF Transcript_94980/g.205036 Transcript_94980/m.205036 type:complete len:229 (+) Transcript_94980:1549-2235(+)